MVASGVGSLSPPGNALSYLKLPMSNEPVTGFIDSWLAVRSQLLRWHCLEKAIKPNGTSPHRIQVQRILLSYW